MTIRNMLENDWPSVAKIYEEGLATGIATFETQVPDYSSWDNAHTKFCRLVAEEDETVLGWAALSPVSSRCVYGGVGEVSVYISKNARVVFVSRKSSRKNTEFSGPRTDDVQGAGCRREAKCRAAP